MNFLLIQPKMRSSLIDKVLKNEISPSDAIEQYGETVYYHCLSSIEVAKCYMNSIESFEPELQEDDDCRFAKFRLNDIKDFNDLILGDSDSEVVRDLMTKSWSNNQWDRIHEQMVIQQEKILYEYEDKAKVRRKIDFYTSVLEKKRGSIFGTRPSFDLGIIYVFKETNSVTIELLIRDLEGMKSSHSFNISFEELKLLFSRLAFQCVKVTIC